MDLSGKIHYEPDSNIVAEFGQMEKYFENALFAMTPNMFWCSVRAHPQDTCLDIGAPSVLGHSLNVQKALEVEREQNTVNLGNIFTGAGDGNLFGEAPCGTGELPIGDGVINSIDLTLLLMYQFKVAPYSDALPADPRMVYTVVGRPGIDDLCVTGIGSGTPPTRTQYMATYNSEYSCGSRRLEEGAGDSNVMTPMDALMTIEYVHSEGTWYKIHLPHTQIQLELVLSGLPLQDGVPLSLRPKPSSQTIGEDEIDLRFTRICEYNFTPECAACADIYPVISSTQAMKADTIALMQAPPFKACPYDIWLWVPQTMHPPLRRKLDEACVGIQAGSFGVNGVTGNMQMKSSCATVAGLSDVDEPDDEDAEDEDDPTGDYDDGTDAQSTNSNVFMWILLILSIAIALGVCMWILNARYGLAALMRSRFQRSESKAA